MTGYGNCFTGAAYLMFKHRKNKPKFILKWRPNSHIPHAMVKTKNHLHHFITEKEFLPKPLNIVFFYGKYQTINLSEESSYQKGKKS